jgi:hypothetical protein
MRLFPFANTSLTEDVFPETKDFVKANRAALRLS